MFRLFFSLILCLFVFHLWVFAQGASSPIAQKQSWKRLESEAKEFALALPSDFEVLVSPQGFSVSNPHNWKEIVYFTDLRAVRAYENGVAIIFERYKMDDAKRGLAILLASEAESESNTKKEAARDFSVNNFIVRQIIDDKWQGFSMKLYLASEKFVYYIEIAARDKNNPSIAPFLACLEVAGKQLIPQTAKVQSSALESVVISTLQNSPFEVIEEPVETKKEEVTQNATKNQTNGKTETVKTPSIAASTDSKPLVIMRQVRPGYTEEARKNNIEGKVRLRMTFSADGQIRKITVISGLKYGLTEKAILAARRMLFLPAEKQGAPVAVSKVVEYRFLMY